MTDIQRQYDVGYLDPQLPRATAGQALRHYLASACIYGVALALILSIPQYRNLLSVPLHYPPKLLLYVVEKLIDFKNIPAWMYSDSQIPAWKLYVYGYYAYLVIAPLIFFLTRPRSLWVSKNLYIVGYLARLARRLCRRPLASDPPGCKPTYQQQQALAFFFIKLFYGPYIINSTLEGMLNESSFLDNAVPNLVQLFQKHEPTWIIADHCYKMLFVLVFILDPLIFAVGYHTESGLLRNKLRYAETNPLHIFVCIMCYPPFNQATFAFFGPSSANYKILIGPDIAHAHPLTWVLRGLAAVFLLLLLAADIFMFTKSSNLTNRGIVTWGPYRLIRHPGYLAKNLFWFMTTIPLFIPNTANPNFSWGYHLWLCAMIVWGLLGWGTLYFLRAITEERFLMRDPDYVAYCQKVKYRFIPGVY